MNSLDKNLLVERYARGRENVLVGQYIEEGPLEIQEDLGLSDEQWEVIFDYLVFEHNLIYKCIIQNSDFFVEEFVRGGAAQVREMLCIEDDKYDMVWNILFDFIAIANEGLYYHVLQHRDRYMVAFKSRGSDFVRKVLGVWNDKYEENWSQILDILLNAVCDSLFSEQTFDHGLRSFSMIMNKTREHRPIFKLGII